MRQFNEKHLQRLVPFNLWHKAGFTTILMDYIETSCHLEIPLQQIEALLISNRAHLFYSLRDKYVLLCRAHSSFPLPPFPDLSDRSRHSGLFCILNADGEV